MHVITLDVVNIAECQYHSPSTEIPNQGVGKEGIGRDVGMFDIIVVINEGTLFRAYDKNAPPH